MSIHRIKIKGATPSTAEGEPCYTCTSHSLARGEKASQEYRMCRAFGVQILMRVTTCTEYKPHNAPSLPAMMSIAWPLCADKKGNPIGFKSPRDAEKLQEEGKLGALKDAQPSPEVHDPWD